MLIYLQFSPISDSKLKLLLQNALTSNIKDINVFISGIDASHSFEGYNVYSIKDLCKK